MRRRAWHWYRCFEPCAFTNKPCTHRDTPTSEPCGKPHTHYQYQPRPTNQEMWSVCCDDHVPENMRG